MSLDRFETISTKVREAIASGTALSESDFDALALELFGFQLANNGFYARYCAAAGSTEPKTWREIPAIPTSAFKSVAIRSFPEDETAHYFETSGTTVGVPGRHYFRSLDLYESAILPSFRSHNLPEGKRMPMLVLTPPPEESPHSSLVHMMKVVIREFGGNGSRYYIRGGEPCAEDFVRDLERTQEPLFLLGTAFAFVFALSTMQAQGIRFSLPPGSRIMETGGFKGRTHEIGRDDFYEQLTRAFGIPASHIVNEYGMTELSSQFYDLSLIEGKPSRRKNVPSWTRVLAMDPATGKPVPDGTHGLLWILDLANVGSVLALQTEDVGIVHSDGTFEVFGRVRAAEPRGCSLAAEELLGQSGQSSD